MIIYNTFIKLRKSCVLKPVICPSTIKDLAIDDPYLVGVLIERMTFFSWSSSFFFKIHGASACVSFSLFDHKCFLSNLVRERAISLLEDKVSSFPDIFENIEFGTF